MSVVLPDELVKRVAGGEAVLFVGSGMSQPRLPGWEQLLKNLLAWCDTQGIPLGEDRLPIEDLIEKKKFLQAARALLGRMKKPRFRQFLDAVFLDPDLEPTAAHRAAAKLPFSAILTTNYDRFLEMAIPTLPVYTQFDADGLGRVLRDRQRAIVKIHGDVLRPDTVVLAQEEYRRGLFANFDFRRFVETILTTRPVLFVGCSLTDYDLSLILEELNYRQQSGLAPHFALMQTKGMNPIERRDFYDSFGIHVVGDDARDDHPDIQGFLGQIAAALPGKDALRPQPPRVSEEEAHDIRTLLEAMGQQLRDMKQGDGRLYFLGEYKAGAEIRSIATCYVPGVATSSDLTPLFGHGEGILLAGKNLPEDVVRAAKTRIIQAYTREEFVSRLADFRPYLAKLRAQYEADEIDRYFVPLKIKEEKKGKLAEKPLPLDEFIRQWLRAGGRNHLSLLGDFGMGKTWFCRRLAYQAAEEEGRVPLLILLRDYSRAYDIEQALTDALVNRFGVELPAGFKTLDRLNREGRLLLIFDGFDEMERRVSDFRAALDNFWEIARLVCPQAKIVLTCRTPFFRHRTEEEEILERQRPQARLGEGDAVIDLAGREGFEVVHLAEFDDGQLREALQKRSPKHWQELYETAQKLPGVEARRPVLLEMIARTLPKIETPQDLNLASLYDKYTSELLARRPSESIRTEDRRSFVEQLAWDMQQRQRLTVPYAEFPDLVRGWFKLDTAEQVAFFERDMRARSILTRDDAGNYGFPHKAMLEFFVARRLASMLARGEEPSIPLTHAIVRFVYHLLAQSYRYASPRIEDGMVCVPAGPFIYGSEEEGNLRIARTDEFWIDRFPVTNEEFCQFLNSEGNRREGGTAWLDNEGSRITKDFEVRKGYERHPVTGVSWYGARAYAKWKKKELPTEEQWEKAARGIDGRKYPWGEDFSTSRCNTAEGGRNGTSPVEAYGGKGQSPFGAQDMAGNVWEWTASLYRAGVDWKVIRGGSWLNSSDYAASSIRHFHDPDYRNLNIGFRCSRTSV